ncbi:hypothetical protein [Corallococcus caeni]|uniref:Uncharacterized protein n=1 Tax=Corallococcus caeni TaxID=3082388 RepID=A0ABQ6QIL3_9BACT|nr:hypothetical protein ASNO1_01520 [Corallococcus sp. NO1]
MFRHCRSTVRVLSALAWMVLPACGDAEWKESSDIMEGEACVGAPARMWRRSLAIAGPLDAAEQASSLGFEDAGIGSRQQLLSGPALQRKR